MLVTTIGGGCYCCHVEYGKLVDPGSVETDQSHPWCGQERARRQEEEFGCAIAGGFEKERTVAVVGATRRSELER